MRHTTKIAAFAVVLALSACGTVPIMNVAEAPAVSASGKNLSKEQVRAAILRAGSGLGWQMRDDGPNTLVGSLMLRKHTAVVAIPYSDRTYGIQYRSSENLDESGGKIHKNYNGWIQNLTRSINAQLTAS